MPVTNAIKVSKHIKLSWIWRTKFIKFNL